MPSTKARFFPEEVDDDLPAEAAEANTKAEEKMKAKGRAAERERVRRGCDLASHMKGGCLFVSPAEHLTPGQQITVDYFGATVTRQRSQQVGVHVAVDPAHPGLRTS